MVSKEALSTINTRKIFREEVEDTGIAKLERSYRMLPKVRQLDRKLMVHFFTMTQPYVEFISYGVRDDYIADKLAGELIRKNIRLSHHEYAELKGNGQQAKAMYLQGTYKGFTHLRQKNDEAPLRYRELMANYIKKFMALTKDCRGKEINELNIKKTTKKTEEKQATAAKAPRTTRKKASQKEEDNKTDEAAKKEAPTENQKPKKTMKIKPHMKVFFRAPASSEMFTLHWSVAISTRKVQNKQSSKGIDALTFMMGPGLEFARMVTGHHTSSEPYLRVCLPSTPDEALKHAEDYCSPERWITQYVPKFKT